jgi:hypothetical protein
MGIHRGMPDFKKSLVYGAWEGRVKLTAVSRGGYGAGNAPMICYFNNFDNRKSESNHDPIWIKSGKPFHKKIRIHFAQKNFQSISGNFFSIDPSDPA